MSEDPALSRPALAEADPYIGLKPYGEAEGDRFFGRERDAQLLIDKLFSNALTLLYAPSGVGKTSLLRARVIPELRAEDAQVVYFDQWNGPDPCAAIARLIAGDGPPDGTGQLVAAVRGRHGTDRRSLVLILDQFEEYLQRYAGDLGSLPAALGALLRAGLDVHVLLSFREEFLAGVDACLRVHVLGLFGSTYHLEHLDRERAAEAIRAPALKFGGSCDDVLVDQLVDDLANGEGGKGRAQLFRGGIELPFLQLICRCLWAHAKKAGTPGLHLADYRRLGGRRGIIAAYLQDVTRHFGFFQSLAAARVMKALAPRSGAKIAYPLEALAAQAKLGEARTQKVLDVLQDKRIVRTRDAGGGVSYELQHDAFIDIVRPWAEQRFQQQRRLMVASLGLALLIGLASNLALWQHERSEREARRLAAEITERIDLDTRQALEDALALAGRSRDPTVHRTLRLATANFLNNPTLAPHRGGASGAVYSRDGRWVLSGGEDGEVHLIERRSLRVQARVKHAGAVLAVAASADAARFVSAGQDGVLRVSDRDGRALTVCGQPGDPPWLGADISRDGTRVVALHSTGDGRPPDLLLTPAGGPCQLTRLAGHFGNVGSAVFDEAGARILSYGNNDNTARVWNAASGALLATLTHPDEVLSANFSSDGQEVTVALADGTIYRWTATGHVIGRPFEIPRDVAALPVLATSARLSPDGRLLAAASSDGHIYLWTLADGTTAAEGPRRLIGVHPGGALAVQFSPAGTRLLSYGVDDSVRVWEAPFSFRAWDLRGHSQGIRSATFAPDGTQVLSAGGDGAVKLWRLQPPDFLPPVGNGLILSRNGRYSFRLGTGQLFETANPDALRALLGAGESVRSAAFSPDESLLAIGMPSGHLRVVHTDSGAPLFDAGDLESPLLALAFDGQGRRLATGGGDGRVHRYDLARPQSDRRGLAAHAGPVQSLDLSPDGRLLVSTGADGAARVWAWTADDEPLSLLEGQGDRVRDARFSADGARILKRTGDRISSFDGDAWTRSADDLATHARALLDPPAR